MDSKLGTRHVLRLDPMTKYIAYSALGLLPKQYHKHTRCNYQ
jgi:hypothetical protein